MKIKLISFIAIAIFIATTNSQAQGEKTLYGHKFYNEISSDDIAGVGKYRKTGRIVKLKKEASAAFMKMRMAAKRDGVTLIPISGFRTVDYQQGLFDKAITKYGSPEKAALWVAPPNYSEHHTGTALDIGDKDKTNCDVELCFENTKAFKWLSLNAETYGFHLSFTKDNGNVNYEPWHWRYFNIN